MTKNSRHLASNLAKIYTYEEDGRKPISYLYDRYNRLTKYGWDRELICIMEGCDLKDRQISIPVYAFLSPKSRDNKFKAAFWSLGGIHGEEPAGPMAIAENIDTINQFNKSGMPMVIAPLLNPLGYCRDSRYYNSVRDTKTGDSVTDPDHLLLDLRNPTKPRRTEASSIYAHEIFEWILKTIELYPPLTVVDHHEDEISDFDNQKIDYGITYSYANGDLEIIAPLCKLINQIFKLHEVPVIESGLTSFGEDIINGFVLNVNDGSVDEFLSTRDYYHGNVIKQKHAAKATFVIETTRDNSSKTPLNKRVDIHSTVIQHYRQIWEAF